MMNFVSKDLLFALLFVVFGAFVWDFVKEQFFAKPCPACICPPSNVTNLIINNEKIKVKGGGSLDLSNILKDNQIIQSSDSTGKKDTLQPKRKGILKRIFNKN